MKRMKYLLTVVLALCLVFSLCACGGGGTVDSSAGDSIVADSGNAVDSVVDTGDVDSTDSTGSGDPVDDNVTYTVVVTDEAGNPVVGAVVQLCKDNCYPTATNEEGAAYWDKPEDDYKVSFVILPSGYEYTTEETDFYFEDGSTKLTIVLKAVS